jgi:subtilisin-like proprotein convertase family protein
MLPVVASLALALGFAPAIPQSATQCATNGPGGFIPGAGASDGIWPLVLPGGSLVSTQVVSVPAAGDVLRSVRIALKHTFASDVQLVLVDPNGAAYNLLQWNDGVAAGSCGADFFGIYDFVDPVAGAGCNGIPALSCNANLLAPGTYRQSFGAWPSGASGVANIPLEQIPVVAGSWSLVIHDWFASADNGALLSWEMCLGAPSPLPPPSASPLQCTSTAPGGNFPQGGASGSWPTVLPSGPLAVTLAVSVPASASRIAALRVFGLAHTWAGDLQLVLEAPSGARYNVVQLNNGTPGGGCSEDLLGDYTFVDALNGVDACGNPAVPLPCVSNALPSGTYAQTFGAWPSGTHGIANLPLEQIPLESGLWTLRAYDWFVPSDSGAFTGWSLCFDSLPAPQPFCRPLPPGTTSGCIATISATGNPSVSSTSGCVLSVAQVEGNKVGLFFYGYQGSLVSSWCTSSTSLLCVKPPTKRLVATDTGGTNGACDGTLSIDLSDWFATHPGAPGLPWSPGQQIWLQGWFRDPPACKTTALSEGIELTWQP